MLGIGQDLMEKVTQVGLEFRDIAGQRDPIEFELDRTLWAK
jgi:hypothetical protein